METILGQCMYFGLSFSRVGCDFRPLMVSIFTKAILNNFKDSLNKATKNFEKNMERFTLINKIHPMVPWKTKNNDALQPPDSLLEFYPLAEYLNNILTSFNTLRLCPPIAIINSIVQELQNSLVRISKLILVLYGQEQQAFTTNSKDAFTRLCMCFSDEMVPFLQKCVHLLFPPNFVAAHIGVSVQDLQKQGLSTLDKNTIIEPIKHLLPVKLETNVLKTPNDEVIDNKDELVESVNEKSSNEMSKSA